MSRFSACTPKSQGQRQPHKDRSHDPQDAASLTCHPPPHQERTFPSSPHTQPKALEARKLRIGPSCFPSGCLTEQCKTLWYSVNFGAASMLLAWWSISPSNEYSGLISFRIELVGSPCSPKDSQESSPTPQFKSISSSALSFLYSPTLNSSLLFLHGLESNPGSSLQTEEEAGLP